MNTQTAQAESPPRPGPTEQAMLVIEENEILLDRIVTFQNGIETVLTTSLDHRQAIAGVEQHLRTLVSDLNASLNRITQLNTLA